MVARVAAVAGRSGAYVDRADLRLEHEAANCCGTAGR